jgi:tRNA dimethylallyltransferase
MSPTPDSLHGTAYVLIGPTAVGKTDLAHALARANDWDILSADALMVYAGMDIGTAKPSPAEREGITYGGMDLATPDQVFSVGAYRTFARTYLQDRREQGRTVLITGGTGLYVKALTHGLDEQPASDSNDRAALEILFQQQGVEGLQALARSEAPDAFAGLRDPANPRRLMRCIEMARQGAKATGESWSHATPGVMVGVSRARENLYERIRARVERMYREGLLEEARWLEARYGALSSTARMAIGYREAYAVLQGHMTEEKAREETAQRTRQYARRQMTWFRNQFHVDWIELNHDLSLSQQAEQVMKLWRKHGPCRLAC